MTSESDEQCDGRGHRQSNDFDAHLVDEFPGQEAAELYFVLHFSSEVFERN
jgi:hypothetical protein